MAALSQMSREEYSRMRIVEGDTIIYSARPIPGNEAAIWRTVNKLFKMGANVIYDNETPVHVSGHAYQEELKMMVNLTRPFYIAPIHGESRHQSLYLDMARQMGYPDHRILTISNGMSLCLDDRRAWIGDEVPTGEVLIDQSGMDGVRPEVMRERTSLGHDGVVVVQLGVNLRTGFIGGRPEIHTRGFSGSAEAVDEVLAVLNAELDGLSPAERTHIETLEKTLTDVLKRSIQRKTQQRPLILPLIVDIPD
jgi:ribonuclease J